MKLSRVVLAALVALPLAGVALAADEPAGQPEIERLPPGAEAAPAGALPDDPMPSPAIPSGAQSTATDPATEGEPRDGEAGAPAREEAEGKGESGADESKAAGDSAPAPASDDDPVIERAKAEAADTPAASAPQEEPAESRI